jgi:hypothetical protein
LLLAIPNNQKWEKLLSKKYLPGNSCANSYSFLRKYTETNLTGFLLSIWMKGSYITKKETNRSNMLMHYFSWLIMATSLWEGSWGSSTEDTTPLIMSSMGASVSWSVTTIRKYFML